MKNSLLFILVFYVSSNLFGQNIYNHIPSKVDTLKKYLFYLHGSIIEEQGIRPVSEKYGTYEYEKILKSLAKTGFNVISEPRPKNTDVFNYAKKVVAQIDSLLKSRVPPKNITVIGASKGAGIAVLISHLLKNDELKNVVRNELYKKVISMSGRHENWITGLNNQQYSLIGLFLGLSGIGYNIMRVFWQDDVPSVLTLDSPIFHH